MIKSKRRTYDYPPRGARTRTQNLNRYLDNLDDAAAITRSPGRCVGCGALMGTAHAPGCTIAKATS